MYKSQQRLNKTSKAIAAFRKQYHPAPFPHMTQCAHPASIIRNSLARPGSITSANVLQMQRAIGNRVVSRLLTKISRLPASNPVARSQINSGFNVNLPCDIYKREGNRVPEQAMSMSESKEQQQEEGLQPKELPGHTSESTMNMEARINAVRGGGQPLSDADRRSMKRSFGFDFNSVRVHTDTHAAQMSRELNAEAFTYGKDIFFGAGRYNPGTSSGKRLLAHELTHVVQQAQPQKGKVSPLRTGIVNTRPLPNTILRRVTFNQCYRSIYPPRFEVSGRSTENFTSAQLCKDEERRCRPGDAYNLGWVPRISGRTFRFFHTSVPSSAPPPGGNVMVKLLRGSDRSATGTELADYGCCRIATRARSR